MHDLFTGPLSEFQSITATFSADWTTRYDQGGLLLHFKQDGVAQDRWIKAGVEFYRGKPYLASVAADRWADWALAPSVADPREKWTTIELRREGDELGTSLWLYQIVDGERVPLREITWVFAEEDKVTVRVAAMAARPAKAEDVVGEEKELVVEFRDVHVQTSRAA
jgi:regulation of enolase protein 1 (concanavalin A-like superfamily)